MSVGGKIIEIAPTTVSGRKVVRIWCVDSDDTETAVHVEPYAVGPDIGETIWWQGGTVYFDRDRQHLTKVGASFDPRKGPTQ